MAQAGMSSSKARGDDTRPDSPDLTRQKRMRAYRGTPQERKGRINALALPQPPARPRFARRVRRDAGNQWRTTRRTVSSGWPIAPENGREIDSGCG